MNKIENNKNIDENQNNEHMSTIKNVSKNRIFKIVLYVLLAIILIFALFCLFYKTTINVSDKNIDKFDYVVNDNAVDFNTDYLEFIKYDSNKNKCTLHITVPKQYIYDKLIKLNEFNKEFNDKYDININRIGFTCDENKPNIIDYSADLSYKNIINAYIHGSIEYKFTNNNGICFYMNSMKIGKNIPEFLYKSFLPFKNGDLIYEVKSDDYDLLKNNVLVLNLIKNIRTDNDNLYFDFDYMSNLKYITKYVFGDDYDTSKIDSSLQKTIPILFEALFGDNQKEYIKIAEKLFPMIIKQ